MKINISTKIHLKLLGGLKSYFHANMPYANVSPMTRQPMRRSYRRPHSLVERQVFALGFFGGLGLVSA